MSLTDSNILSNSFFDLVAQAFAINANHLFDSGTTYIGFRRGTYLRSHLYEFIQMFAPHLKTELIAKACATKSKKELDKIFESIKLIRR